MAANAQWRTGQYTQFAGGTQRASPGVVVTADDRVRPPAWSNSTRQVKQAGTAQTVEQYYVDTASTAGGDGTTSATTGATRAYATLNAAVTACCARNLVNANVIIRVSCAATTGVADTTAAIIPTSCVTGLGNYVEIIGDAFALKYDTAKYSIEVAGEDVIESSSARQVRFTGLQLKTTFPAAAFGAVSVYLEGSAGSDPHDYRFDACHFWGVVDAGRTSGVYAVTFNGVISSSAQRLVLTNCVVRGYTGAGSPNHAGFALNKATITQLAYNCTAYNCANGFLGGTAPIAKNCGAVSCTDGFSGTWDTVTSTNNASDLAGDAVGGNAQNSVTPTFVDAAGGDFHLLSSDTAWRGFGADLSADALYPFTTDGDGETRAAWDIGADEYIDTSAKAPDVVFSLIAVFRAANY